MQTFWNTNDGDELRSSAPLKMLLTVLMIFSFSNLFDFFVCELLCVLAINVIKNIVAVVIIFFIFFVIKVL